MFCENCGKKLPDDAVFCDECGTKVQQKDDENKEPENNKQTVENVQPKKEEAVQQVENVQPEKEEAVQQAENIQPMAKKVQYGTGNGQKKPDVQPEKSPVVMKTPQKVPGVMSQWLYALTLFVLFIPIVGLVMTFVWAFKSKNPNRKNLCIGFLIFYIFIVIVMLVLLISGVAVFDFIGGYLNI